MVQGWGRSVHSECEWNLKDSWYCCPLSPPYGEVIQTISCCPHDAHGAPTVSELFLSTKQQFAPTIVSSSPSLPSSSFSPAPPCKQLGLVALVTWDACICRRGCYCFDVGSTCWTSLPSIWVCVQPFSGVGVGLRSFAKQELRSCRTLCVARVHICVQIGVALAALPPHELEMDAFTSDFFLSLPLCVSLRASLSNFLSHPIRWTHKCIFWSLCL